MEEKKETLERSDTELIALARKRDSAAWDELGARYSNLIRGCARRFMLPTDETEELVQEGMIGLFFAVSSYDESHEAGASFKTFLKTCVWHRINDVVRKKNKEKGAVTLPFDLEIVSKETSPEEQLIESEEKEEFLKKMSGALTDYEFRAVVYYIEGLNYSEIAQRIGRTEKGVDNALQRARKKLQNVLKK